MRTRSTVVVAPVLRPDVREYTRAIRECGALRHMVGGTIYHETGYLSRAIRELDRIAGTTVYRRTEARRVNTEALPRQLTASIYFELLSRVSSRLRLARGGSFAVDAIFAKVDSIAAKVIDANVELVVGQEDCCLSSFAAAHRVGAKTLYDLPIPYHTELERGMTAEETLFPSVCLQNEGVETFAAPRKRRKVAELAVADHVLVASKYVQSSLQSAGIPLSRITRIPYGCDDGRPFVPYSDRKPIVLYVGHLSLRKGTPRLLRVWKKLGAHRTHTLRLIGKQYLQPSFLAEFSGIYEHIPNMPRSELWKHYCAAQLFVFPSACDGFGLVLNEALSCGTPIIASSNTGAPGFITDGVEGVTYEHGDDEALATHLEQMLSTPTRTAEMGRAAYEFAQVNGWLKYRGKIRELVTKLLGEPRL